MFPWWVLAIGALLCIVGGYFSRVLMELVARFAKRWFHAADEDVRWWTLIALGLAATAFLVYPTMIENCEPGYTCRLLP